MREQPIGVFDSGLGGLSILRSLQRRIPHESLLYVGDNRFAPYGEKKEQWIRSRVYTVLRFFQKNGCKMVVIACNTATVAGISAYRRAFPDVPIVGLVPAIRPAVRSTSSRDRILVLSTPFTSESPYQKRLVREFGSGRAIDVAALPNDIVRLIEEGKRERVRRDVHRALAPWRSNNTTAVVLGCTHYEFIRREIRSGFAGAVRIFSSKDAVALRVETLLLKDSITAGSADQKIRYITTGDGTAVSHTASKLLGKTVQFEQSDIT